MTINPAILQISDCILCEKDGAPVLAEVKDIVLDAPKKYLKLYTRDYEQTHFVFYFDDATRVEFVPNADVISDTAQAIAAGKLKDVAISNATEVRPTNAPGIVTNDPNIIL